MNTSWAAGPKTVTVGCVEIFVRVPVLFFDWVMKVANPGDDGAETVCPDTP